VKTCEVDITSKDKSTSEIKLVQKDKSIIEVNMCEATFVPLPPVLQGDYA
jgi:hypothetical protein